MAIYPQLNHQHKAITWPTKNYIDHLPGLTWPEGGVAGAMLIYGETGPYWDAPLTWADSLHSAYDCDRIGGTVFDTGETGTICRYPGAEVPDGWSWAAYWQRYNPPHEYDQDACGRYVSTRPITFKNEQSTDYNQAPGRTACLPACSCDELTNCYHDYYHYGDITPGGCYQPAVLVTQHNIPTDRVEIGIY